MLLDNFYFQVSIVLVWKLNGPALWNEHIITSLSKRRTKEDICIRNITNMCRKTLWIRGCSASELVNIGRWQVGRSLNGDINNSYLDMDRSWKRIIYKENRWITMEWRFDKCLVYYCTLCKEFVLNLVRDGLWDLWVWTFDCATKYLVIYLTRRRTLRRV